MKLKDDFWLSSLPSNWQIVRNLGLFSERIEKGNPELELLVVSQAHGIVPQKEYAELVERKDSSNQDKSNYKTVKKNDIAYNKMRMWQGAVGVSKYHGIVSPAYVVLKPHDGVFPKFYYYLFKSKEFISEAGKYSYGICDDMNSLRYEDFKSIYSPLPSPPIQKAIASYLDKETARIDALIEKKERQIELLQEKRQAIITRAVTKGLNPNAKMKDSRIEWIGEIPENWEVRKLAFCASFISGSTPDKGDESYWSGDIPWVSPKDMKRKYIDDSIDHLSKDAVIENGLKILNNETILVVVRGMILVHSFPVAITKVPLTINQDIKGLNFDEQILPEFAANLLSGFGKVIVTLYVDNSAHGTKAIRMDNWKDFPILCPSIREQQTIIEYLHDRMKSIDLSISKIQSSTSLLYEYRSSLITSAVSGQIDLEPLQ